MRLIKYINEERQLMFPKIKEFEKSNKNIQRIKTFEKDVKPWFNYCKKQGVKNKFLWRGSSSHVVKDFKKLKTRTNREPTDMCIEMHDFLDDHFYNKFKIHARSQTVFCFPNIISAKHYGSIQNIIVPVGKYFNYIWSPKIDDLFTFIENEDYYYNICNNDVLNSYDFENEYEEEYGEYSGNGTWYYDNIDTGDSDWSSAKSEIIRDFLDSGMDIEEAEDEFESHNMEWVEEIDMEDFIDKKVEDSKDDADDIINNYIMNKRFKDLMDSKSYRSNEIMLDCKSYYIINEDFAKKYLEMY